MRAAPLWDLFCTVIDNHGDLGVCWRLSRQLRDAGQRVRLWVDEASALAWMAPNAAQEAGIELRSWQQAIDPAVLQGLAPAQVWVEAFGCDLPEAFVAHGVRSRPEPPAWINLEYLSAENWVPRFHGLSSPVMSGPAKGWTKRFFYPGFTEQTGGLLRESDLLERQRRFDRQAWRTAHHAEPAAGGRLISLFCYESPCLPGLLSQLAGGTDLLLVTPGRPLAAVESALTVVSPEPKWLAPPYTSQDGFDEMLWACDFNVVRGEDSLVRALWAGQAFIWHIYPQDDRAHHAKLEAFLDWLQAPPCLRRMHALWNGLAAGDIPVLNADTLALWRECAASARQRLLAQGDLLSHLLRWLPS
jgi:uncharacterized repeat protein (TIGR03837 family)